MKKRIISLALSAVMGLSLAGCSSVGFSVDKLMHPPKAVGDKAEIQSLIDSVAGEDYTLKYPRNGNYKSAITMKDIDSDSVEEAIAFYLPAGDIATVHMLVMDNIDDTWQAVGNFKSQSTAVDSLSFCDLDGNGILEIITSWKTYNTTTNQLSVYIYEDTQIREVSSEHTCSSFIIGDFAENDGEELLLLTLFSADRDASASLMALNNSKSNLKTLGTTALDPDVVSYAQLLTGDVFENQFGAVIDGCTASGEYSTQLLYYNSYFSSLERITFTENVAYNQAVRSYPVMSKDINDDGIIEVPSAFKLSIEENRTDAVSAASIYWCQHTATGPVLLIKHQAASFAFSFTFDIPTVWEGKITALTDYSKNEVTFYEWNKDKTGNPLLVIKIFDKNTEVDYTQYTLLEETDNRIYAYFIPDNTSSLLLGDSEVKAAFELM